jgi:hypothetical protein
MDLSFFVKSLQSWFTTNITVDLRKNHGETMGYDGENGDNRQKNKGCAMVCPHSIGKL